MLKFLARWKPVDFAGIHRVCVPKKKQNKKKSNRIFNQLQPEYGHLKRAHQVSDGKKNRNAYLTKLRSPKSFFGCLL